MKLSTQVTHDHFYCHLMCRQVNDKREIFDWGHRQWSWVSKKRLRLEMEPVARLKFRLWSSSFRQSWCSCVCDSTMFAETIDHDCLDWSELMDEILCWLSSRWRNLHFVCNLLRWTRHTESRNFLLFLANWSPRSVMSKTHARRCYTLLAGSTPPPLLETVIEQFSSSAYPQVIWNFLKSSEIIGMVGYGVKEKMLRCCDD